MATRRTLRTLALLAVAMVLTTAACTSDPDPGPTTPVTIPPPEQTHRDLPAPADPLPLSDAAAWSGVGQLRLAGQCTATLLDTGVPAGPAYVLTNGHCAGGWGSHPGFVLVDGDAEDAGSVAFGLVAGAAPGPVLDVVAVPYATMSRYDLAVVQLAGTLADAQGQGLRALPLATSAPRTGDRVVNVGVPVRELAEQDWVLRTGTCTLGEPVDLLESEWTWSGSWPNDCPGIVQGSSGSPLVADGAVVAVINTTTYGGFVRGGLCAINNPCEVRDDGVEVVPDRSYAVPIEGVASCFGADGVFVLAGGCPLPRPPDVAASAFPSVFSLDDVRAGSAGAEVVLTADVAARARYGLVPVGDGAGCADEAVYTGTVLVQAADVAGDGLVQATTVPVDLPAVEGRSWWCVTTGSAAQATGVLLEVDGTPPVFAPGITVEDLGDALWVTPAFAVPELADSLVKVGPVGSTDCADESGYGRVLQVSVTIDHGDLPVTFCVLSSDAAGNRAPPAQFTIR